MRHACAIAPELQMETEIRSIILSSLTTIGMRMHQQDELHVLTASKYYGKLELVRSYTQCLRAKLTDVCKAVADTPFCLVLSSQQRYGVNLPGQACCPLN